MKKRFNITGICYPHKHYMVNLDTRLAKIKDLVDYGDYFVINRARQYGKTTTLWALREYLRKDYIVLFLNFQRLSAGCFENEYVFVKHFPSVLAHTLIHTGVNLNSLGRKRLRKQKIVVRLWNPA